MTTCILDGVEWFVRHDGPHGDLDIINDVYTRDTYRLKTMRDFTPRVIVDIGAQIGTFAKLAHSLWPDARIVCLEPSPPNFECLEKNAPFAECVRGAIAPKGRVFIDHDGSTGGGFATTQEDLNTRTDLAHCKILDYALRCMTFMELLAEKNITEIDLLKIDCEGGEWDLMAELPLPGITIEAIVGEYHARGAGAFRVEVARAFPGLKVDVINNGLHLGPFFTVV